jgi:4-hydroxythreonine-4-phosphate dehydrogenase
MVKPVIAVTLGDPCGIGPEIAVKAFGDRKIYDVCVPILIGDLPVVRRALVLSGLDLEIHPITEVSQAAGVNGTIDLIDTGNSGIENLAPGKVQGAAGQAAFSYIEKSIELAVNGSVDAVATGPINKESLRAARINYIGHTEIFAGLTNTEDPLTMFEVRNLRVFFLSRHVSLQKACGMVTKERIVNYIARCSDAVKQLGITHGTMAIAGLNPHSGEHGLFGDEEQTAVEPAVKEMAAQGYSVAGPVSADSVFYQALQGRYTSVLSLYHDQGHIATKTLDFERTISITHGLPFLRTSVDHGTAFDIAGKDLASPVSITEAVLIAAKYALSFRTQKGGIL